MENSANTKQPEISVVVASVNGAQYLEDFLSSMAQQTIREDAEVVIADCCGNGVRDLVRQRYPAVKLISFRERRSVPELRAIATRNSRGKIISITEDHCVVQADWCERMLAAHQHHFGVIGGAVENDPSIRSVIDWAVYFCEYSQYMNPVPAAEVADVPGNNLSYRREFLSSIDDLLDGRHWEDALIARLRQKGIKSFSDPSIIVYHKKNFAFGYFLAQRYHYSRAYAGMRAKTASIRKRVVYAAATALLPPLLLFRIVSRVGRKKRHLDKLITALPLIAIFTLSWSAGELVGYLFGSGRSLIEVQ